MGLFDGVLVREAHHRSDSDATFICLLIFRSIMCGRFSQSRDAVLAACRAMGIDPPEASDEEAEEGPDPEEHSDRMDSARRLLRDNYNLSPGMEATIIVHEGKELKLKRKVWGLIPIPGTERSPLPTGMSQHFSNLMFNARSDEGLKPTFQRLLKSRRTCLVPMDGFFEWKQEQGQKKKQPYFVHTEPMLVVGLWTSVATGRPMDSTLDTFTLLTTAACKSLQWLHHRMPVISNDRTWLESTHPKTPVAITDKLEWHAVTPDMNSLKYRSADALKALPKPTTIESLWAKQPSPAKKPVKTVEGGKVAVVDLTKHDADTKDVKEQTAKRSATTKLQSPPRKKSGTIHAFFKPKT